MGRRLRLCWLSADDPPEAFPDTRHALSSPDGLLAAGGDLSAPRLLYAYRHGIFPWYEPGQPILWWSPDPRTVLFPERMHVSRRLARELRQGRFEFSLDTDFAGVIDACAAPRRYGPETWITPGMRAAYLHLHALGHAHSLEVWCDGALVGGVYGVRLGTVFFGESMFSRVPNASKAALAVLCRELQPAPPSLIDCQLESAHLLRLGAERLSRDAFLALLDRHCDAPAPQWRLAGRE